MSSEDENDAVFVEHEHAEKESAEKKGEEAAETKDEPKAEEPKKEESEKEEPKEAEEEEKEKEEEKTPEQIAKEKEEEELKQEALHPRALQMVSIGTEDNAYAFSFHEEKLQRVLGRVPPNTKVAIVSVVGAFRTGKSFLLSWFLRYLNHLTADTLDSAEPELVDEGDKDKKWYEKFNTLGNDGFEWKAGSERNTTGIWVWSQPFMLKEKNMAVLLVDTQGMFDHETTMKLTSAIFGLSTLLSSYQIYNVDKRVQEDNLQQLALFSEYARMAVNNAEEAKSATNEKARKPFQLVEFLVRDWQHYEDDDSFETMEQSMVDYLDKLIADRDADDLQETRDQINSCFESVSCYGFCHPGFAVTKSKYSGDVGKIEELFLQLLDRYCQKVFSQAQPKVVHGRELTAASLSTYLEKYAKLFESGANFPEASTMLEATASANNTVAVEEALDAYEEVMERLAGPEAMNYLQPDLLLEQHQQNVTAVVDMFDRRANFGNREKIAESKRQLLGKIERDYEKYEKLNQSRNPLFGLEMYIIPVTVAFGSYIVRVILDWSCAPWSQICKAGSSAFTQVYAVVFCFLLIVGATKAKEIRDVFLKLKAAFDAMNQPHRSVKAKAD